MKLVRPTSHGPYSDAERAGAVKILVDVGRMRSTSMVAAARASAAVQALGPPVDFELDVLAAAGLTVERLRAYGLTEES